MVIRRYRHLKADVKRLVPREMETIHVPISKLIGKVVLLPQEEYKNRAYAHEENVFYWRSTPPTTSSSSSFLPIPSSSDSQESEDSYLDPDI